MAIRVDLPKDLALEALKQAKSLRTRNAKAATNLIIRQALEEEENKIAAAINTITEIK